MRGLFSFALFVSIIAFTPASIIQAEQFRVATYNVENYLSQPTPTRPHLKTEEAKARVRESIRALNADVIALQEIGDLPALLELRDSLKREGTDFPYWEFISGTDTNIHLSLLSRFPFSSRHPHTNDTFLLSGRRFHVSRGFAEVSFNVTPTCSITLITAHLKSKRTVPEADETELRLEESKVLRKIIDSDLAANPNLNLIVLGDFNDTKDSASTQMLIGRGKRKLIDTRPAERNGDTLPAANRDPDPRNVTWTHYYGIEDTYSRIDYILLSPAMARLWNRSGTYVLALPNWGLASDHRPLVATFTTDN